MPISPPHFSALPVSLNTKVVIELLPSRPVASSIISPAKAPGQLCGYYNATGGYVELYVVDATGIKFKRIG